MVLVKFKPSEYNEIDSGIRKNIRKHKVRYNTGNMERLYLYRSELERGLS